MPSSSTTSNHLANSGSSSIDASAASLPNNSEPIDSTHPDRVIFRGGDQTNNSTNTTDSYTIDGGDTERIIDGAGGAAANEDEPIAPIRPPIHSKTKNWYSIFCNRWASLVGVNYGGILFLNIF